MIDMNSAIDGPTAGVGRLVFSHDSHFLSTSLEGFAPGNCQVW